MRRLLQLLATLFILFLLLPSFVEFYTDWLWFGELGYQHVFVRILSARSWIVLGVFLIALAFVLANLRVALRSLTRREMVIVTAQGPRVVVIDPARLRTIAYALAGIGSLVIALIAGSDWDTWLFYWNAVPFNQQDPI